MHVDHSIFVGDLAPEVTDYMLQEHFRQYYPSVRSAKVTSPPAADTTWNIAYRSLDTTLRSNNSDAILWQPLSDAFVLVCTALPLHLESASLHNGLLHRKAGLALVMTAKAGFALATVAKAVAQPCLCSL